MKDPVRILLRPLGAVIEVERHTPLQEILFPYGVEFPCGGNAQCEGCRVKVLEGVLAVTPAQEKMLSEKDLRAGWRLACCCAAEGDITLELAQWEANVLIDHTTFDVTPRDGMGVAVDLGTTTIAAQLLDLRTGNVVAVQTGLNEQAMHGADVMSRINVALTPGGEQKLTRLVRRQVGEMIHALLTSGSTERPQVREVVLVGNTAMHHLFSGLDVTALSHYPFEPADDRIQTFVPEQLGWDLPDTTPVRFLPCLGSFVGSDLLAGVFATKLLESNRLVSLIDLGTNGEIVLGDRRGLLYCSTAAGPAFEGSRISMGMRATTGAISEVRLRSGRIDCRVLGNVPPRGICGSGLVDAIAVGLELGRVAASGRLADGSDTLALCPPVTLSQADIREVQVGKAAIAAGFRILLQELGASLRDVSKVFLAGAFGNYVDRGSARRIGLLQAPLQIVKPAGNTALLGAKLALFRLDDWAAEIRAKSRHISLNTNAAFQDIFVEEMVFPRS